MHTALRDLERLRERDEAPARRLVMLLLATFVTIGLIVSVGIVLNGSRPLRTTATDSLSTLEGFEMRDSIGSTPAFVEVPKVEPTELVFPEALLEAATPAQEVDDAVARAGLEAEQLLQAEALPTNLPVAAAMDPAQRALARAESDPLLLASVQTSPSRNRAAEGRDGKYTLHVMSFRSETEARAFSDTLRERGHQAFVIQAESGDRGTVYRVRVGPFETSAEAERQRREFEARENMNTFVVAPVRAARLPR